MAWVMVRATNYMTFFFGALLAVQFTFYLRTYIEERMEIKVSTRYLEWAYMLFLVMVTELSVNLFYPFLYQIDEANLYSRLPLYPLLMLPPLGLIILGLFMVIRFRRGLTKGEVIPMIVYLLVPVFTTAASSFTYGIALAQYGSTLSIIVMYIMVQAEQGRVIVEKEKELVESRLDISLSQIQPHFLYNTLSTISSLCLKNPEQASEATDRLTKYLRVNLDSLKQKELVSFQKELDHVQTYLYLEKMRFGEELNIEYDLQELDFELPQLIVQPIVENAVVHGFMGSEDPVTITISSYRHGDDYMITVTDNGCGFDMNAAYSPEKSHVGLSNVKKRLEYMVDGDLKIQSRVGIGTAVMIRIPGQN